MKKFEQDYRDRLHTIQEADEVEKERLIEQLENEKQKKAQSLKPMDRVVLARHKNRWRPMDYVTNLFEDILFQRGDRRFKDDESLKGGIARFHGQTVSFIATDKGSGLEDCLECNFGMVSPEGYRKAVRIMEAAEKFGRPILNFVDTPGAYPGIGAEERGQGEAIATSILKMLGVRVPVLTVITGEGGSGGALALSAGNELYMLENSIYSILSPEGFSSILWKDASGSDRAASLMRLTAGELKEDGVCDVVIKEGICLDYEDFYPVKDRVDQQLYEGLKRLKGLSTDELVLERKDKFRNYGRTSWG